MCCILLSSFKLCIWLMLYYVLFFLPLLERKNNCKWMQNYEEKIHELGDNSNLFSRVISLNAQFWSKHAKENIVFSMQHNKWHIDCVKSNINHAHKIQIQFHISGSSSTRYIWTPVNNHQILMFISNMLIWYYDDASSLKHSKFYIEV